MSGIDAVMLAVIGVLTPVICFGGIGLAYWTQERDATKRTRKTPRNAVRRQRSGGAS